jgi:hypothetical protein
MQKLIQSLIKASVQTGGYVQKLGKNPIGYSFVTEANVVTAVRNALLENGIIIVPDVIQHTFDPALGLSEVFINFRVYHESGESLEFKVAGQGMDRNSKGVGDKAVYKAITGANKYALLKLLLIATGDDPEFEAKEAAPEKNPALEHAATMIVEFLPECNSIDVLRKYWKDNVEMLNDINRYSRDLYTSLLGEFERAKKRVTSGAALANTEGAK